MNLKKLNFYQIKKLMKFIVLIHIHLLFQKVILKTKLKENKKLYSFGYNGDYNLGTGDNISISEPKEININNSYDNFKIYGRYYHHFIISTEFKHFLTPLLNYNDSYDLNLNFYKKKY